MSGIAGIVYPDHIQNDHLISPMLKIMAHRGPGISDEHTYRNIHVGICGGKLAKGKGNVIAGLDGTIRNADSLRQELAIPSAEESNGSILIYAYERWGTSFAEHLQGDFAFFLLDPMNERLLIARDRIGKKPLYWYNQNGYFIFASELKAILATGIVPQTPAPDAIATYLHFGYLPQDMSPIKDVNKLLPCHYLIFQRNNIQSIHSYWSYSSYFQQQKTVDRQSIVHHLDHLLHESVERQLPEKRPIGCLVAGGLGSACIAHYLRQFVPGDQVQALTIEFQGENTQDFNAAREAAESLHLQRHCDLVTPQNFLDDLVKIAWHLDEPIADPNVIATWRLAKSAQKLGSLYSGMGSDELLAGHSRYSLAERHASISDRFLQFSMPAIKLFLVPALKFFYKPAAYKILQKTQTNPWLLDFIEQNSLFSQEVRTAAAPSIAGLFDPVVFLHKFHNLPHIPSTVASFLYFDVKTRLADCYMLQYERLTAAHALDWRAPFLSEPLIEYLASLSDPEKLMEKESFFVLKDLLKGTFSESFINRPKKLRRQFLHSWVDRSELHEIFQMLHYGTLTETGLISRKWLASQLASPSKVHESFKLLWGLLALEIWFQLYVNRPVPLQAPDITVKQLLKG